MQFKMYLTLALLLLVVIFTVQNATVVPVKFLFWKIEISRALLIFFTFVIGTIVGWVAHSYKQHARHNKRTMNPD
jgi:putative membrane protein